MCAVMVLLSGVYPYSYAPKASAQQTLEDLENEYKDLEEDLKKNEEKLADIQSDITSNEKKLTSITGQIETIKGQIDVLDKKIGVLNESIGELQPKIDTLQGEIDGLQVSIDYLNLQMEEARALSQETEAALLERIREDYMSGGNASMLEILFSSDDLTSFLSRMELVDRVSEQETMLIEQLAERVEALDALEKEAQHEKAAVELKKAQLDSSMNELTSNQQDLQSSLDASESKQENLSDKYEQVQDLLVELDEDSEAYQKEIARQRAEMEQLSKEIDDYIAKNGSSVGDKPTDFENDGKLLFPLPYDNCYISCHYGYYSDGSRHWGTDLCVRGEGGGNASNGKDIVAAQSGEVIIAYNDGNWNSGFGNYCVIDHGDGMLTLYAHCKRLTVSKGEIVKKGEKIAEIGLTGNTTGYHLHFEVRIKNADGTVNRVNPENYIKCP